MIICFTSIIVINVLQRRKWIIVAWFEKKYNKIRQNTKIIFFKFANKPKNFYFCFPSSQRTFQESYSPIKDLSKLNFGWTRNLFQWNKVCLYRDILSLQIWVWENLFEIRMSSISFIDFFLHHQIWHQAIKEMSLSNRFKIAESSFCNWLNLPIFLNLRSISSFQHSLEIHV